jgi:hypothetical protein
MTVTHLNPPRRDHGGGRNNEDPNTSSSAGAGATKRDRTSSREKKPSLDDMSLSSSLRKLDGGNYSGSKTQKKARDIDMLLGTNPNQSTSGTYHAYNAKGG